MLRISLAVFILSLLAVNRGFTLAMGAGSGGGLGLDCLARA